MTGNSRWLRTTVAVLAFVSIVGCGLTGGDGNNGSDGGGGDPGGIGAPGGGGGGGGGGEALGSPIDIPAITQRQGEPIDEVSPDAEAELVKACGGELCVEIVTRAGTNDILTRCQFDRIDPEPGTTVQRQSTVFLLTGSRPCDPPSSGQS